VTGATGSLGAHVIAQLIALDDVKKVYCPVRASSSFNAKLRVIRSLRARSLYHNLPLAARVKIIAVPSNFGHANLGFDEKTYTQVSSEITSLIHCAWSVNFNLGLGSFEADCIAGELIQCRFQPS
jgi:thioester reductase-like protein